MVIPFPYAVPLGTSVHDTATIVDQVSGLPATGTVTYQFYTTIDGTGAHTDEVVTLNPDGTVPESPLQGPLAAGRVQLRRRLQRRWQLPWAQPAPPSSR